MHIHMNKTPKTKSKQTNKQSIGRIVKPQEENCSFVGVWEKETAWYTTKESVDRFLEDYLPKIDLKPELSTATPQIWQSKRLWQTSL